MEFYIFTIRCISTTTKWKFHVRLKPEKTTDCTSSFKNDTEQTMKQKTRHTHWGGCWHQISLELELQKVVVWMLGTELGSPARAVHDLNHWVISPASNFNVVVGFCLVVVFSHVRIFLCSPGLTWNSLCRPGRPRTQRSACLCLPSAGI